MMVRCMSTAEAPLAYVAIKAQCHSPCFLKLVSWWHVPNRIVNITLLLSHSYNTIHSFLSHCSNKRRRLSFVLKINLSPIDDDFRNKWVINEIIAIETSLQRFKETSPVSTDEHNQWHKTCCHFDENCSNCWCCCKLHAWSQRQWQHLFLLHNTPDGWRRNGHNHPLRRWPSWCQNNKAVAVVHLCLGHQRRHRQYLRRQVYLLRRRQMRNWLR